MWVALESGPGRMCGFQQIEERASQTGGNMIKAEDRVKLKAQVICRKLLEDKCEKLGWAQTMRV